MLQHTGIELLDGLFREVIIGAPPAHTSSTASTPHTRYLLFLMLYTQAAVLARYMSVPLPVCAARALTEPHALLGARSMTCRAIADYRSRKYTHITTPLARSPHRRT